MATKSFFIGYEIKDKARALKILSVLKKKGKPINLTEEERKMFKKQIEKGKNELPNLIKYIGGL